MAFAEQDSVFGVRWTLVAPRFQVVGFCPGGGPVAILDRAVAVLGDAHREALWLGVEPCLPSEIEHLGVGSEYGGDDTGVARQPAGLTSGEVLSRVQQGGADPTEQ